MPILLLLPCLFGAAPIADSRLSLIDAMGAELARNQKELRLSQYELPYFISYQMKDFQSQEISGRYGAIFQDQHDHDRKLYVEVRVGDHGFDSSTADEMDFTFSTKGTSYVTRKLGPLDDDPAALRTALWLVTDEKYKNALFNYSKKKGENVYAVEDPKRPPSFSREKANQYVQAAVPFSFDRPGWTRKVRALSAKFTSQAMIFDSEVSVTADKVTRYFVSSEGGRILTEQTLYGAHVSAVTRAEDGQLLDSSKDFYAPAESGLPDEAQLMRATDQVVAELLALRLAPAADPYTGPAILEPEAAGVLFHEAVGHRLEGDRQDSEGEGKTFRGQVGKRVLPAFISIYDDPGMTVLGGVAVNGHYLFDEEGIRGQRADLIEKGVLKTFLLSRHPIEGALQSNGHGRSQGNHAPVARMANLVVESKRQVSDAELKRMLIAEAGRQGKPFGLIIRNITGGNTNTSSYGYQAFKGIPRMVYRVDVRDGKETLVRGVEIVGTPLASMSKIMATGKDTGVFNGYCGAESGHVPVSASAPAVLLQELELQRTVEGKDRPPILGNPSRSAISTEP